MKRSVPRPTIGTLMLAVFTVSVGFGIALPLLLDLIERLLVGDGTAAQISQHTGLLTAVYTFSLFLFAPMWGRLSDRRDLSCASRSENAMNGGARHGVARFVLAGGIYIYAMPLGIEFRA